MNTQHKKIIIIIIFTVMLALIFAISAEAKNNIALDCKIDSVCGESGGNKSAAMLVDGDPNYETKWEVSDGANHSGEPHWIIFDFETDKMIDSIRLIKASQGAVDFGRTEFDASGFRFEISFDKKSWAVIDEVTDDGSRDIYERSFIDVFGRYLKLTIIHPEQDEKSNENQAVRLYDLKVFEYIPVIIEEEPEEEISDIESGHISDDILYAPKTFDSIDTILLLFVLFCAVFVIYRIFLNRRSRSV